MALPQIEVVSDESDVELRLARWGLRASQFLDIARTAHSRAVDAGPLMPKSSPGMLAYLFGTEELRLQIIGDDWRVDITDNIEGVINLRFGVRIVYQNVDRACDRLFPPRPRSAKGSASENLCGPDLFTVAGVDTGPLRIAKRKGISTYHVMVGEDGSVELSSPVIVHGRYVQFNERIFIANSVAGPMADDPEVIDPVQDLDIDISFKEP